MKNHRMIFVVEKRGRITMQNQEKEERERWIWLLLVGIGMIFYRQIAGMDGV